MERKRASHGEHDVQNRVRETLSLVVLHFVDNVLVAHHTLDRTQPFSNWISNTNFSSFSTFVYTKRALQHIFTLSKFNSICLPFCAHLLL